MMTKLVARISRVLSPEHFIVGGVFTRPGQALLTPALLLTRYLLHLTSDYTAWQFRLTFTFSNPTSLFVRLLDWIHCWCISSRNEPQDCRQKGQRRVEAVSPRQRGRGEVGRVRTCVCWYLHSSTRGTESNSFRCQCCVRPVNVYLNDVERMLSP